jgi:hypothetical protein
MLARKQSLHADHRHAQETAHPDRRDNSLFGCAIRSVALDPEVFLSRCESVSGFLLCSIFSVLSCGNEYVTFLIRDRSYVNSTCVTI